MRFAMTAKSLVRERLVTAAAAAGDGVGKGIREITARNVAKVTRFRPRGEMELMREVRRLEREEKERIDVLEEEDARKLDEGDDEDEDDKEEDFDVKLRRRPVREGWERWDRFERDERRRRKAGYKIREVTEREAERKRLRG